MADTSASLPIPPPPSPPTRCFVFPFWFVLSPPSLSLSPATDTSSFSCRRSLFFFNIYIFILYISLVCTFFPFSSFRAINRHTHTHTPPARRLKFQVAVSSFFSLLALWHSPGIVRHPPPPPLPPPHNNIKPLRYLRFSRPPPPLPFLPPPASSLLPRLDRFVVSAGQTAQGAPFDPPRVLPAARRS